MNKAEVIAEVKKIRRLCLGPRLHNIATMDALRPRLFTILASKNMTIAAAFKLELEKKTGAQVIPIANNNWAAMERRLIQLCFGRTNLIGKPCNYDFNSIVIAGSLDGKAHSFTCPKCGQSGSYRAPLAES